MICIFIYVVRVRVWLLNFIVCNVVVYLWWFRNDVFSVLLMVSVVVVFRVVVIISDMLWISFVNYYVWS